MCATCGCGDDGGIRMIDVRGEVTVSTVPHSHDHPHSHDPVSYTHLMLPTT